MSDIVRELRQMSEQNWLGGMKDRRRIAGVAAAEIERLREHIIQIDEWRETFGLGEMVVKCPACGTLVRPGQGSPIPTDL